MERLNEGKKLNVCFSGIKIYWNNALADCKEQFIEEEVPKEMKRMKIKNYTIKRVATRMVDSPEKCRSKKCITNEPHINVSAYIYD